MELRYCVNTESDEPILLINQHIGFDETDGPGVDGAAFQKELLYLDTLGKKRIQVWINSAGGSVIEGYSIISAILKSKTPVDTYNVGMAASTAAQIFMSGRRRVMLDFAQFMVHPTKGTTTDAAKESFENSIATILSAKSNLSQFEVADLMAVTSWLNADECLQKGFATEIEKTADVNKKRMSQKDVSNVSDFIFEANLITNKLIENSKPQKKVRMLKVTNKLGLTEDANEESILAGIAAIENKAVEVRNALQAEIEDLKAKNTSLESEIETVKTTNCKNLIDGFVAVGKIANDEAVINKWVDLAKNDFEGTKTILEGLPVNKAAVTIETEEREKQAKPGDYMHAKMKEIANRNK